MFFVSTISSVNLKNEFKKIKHDLRLNDIAKTFVCKFVFNKIKLKNKKYKIESNKMYDSIYVDKNGNTIVTEGNFTYVFKKQEITQKQIDTVYRRVAEIIYDMNYGS